MAAIINFKDFTDRFTDKFNGLVNKEGFIETLMEHDDRLRMPFFEKEEFHNEMIGNEWFEHYMEKININDTVYLKILMYFITVYDYCKNGWCSYLALESIINEMEHY